MSKAQRIQGVFVPNIVPLDGRGEIDEAQLRRYTSWLIAHGVHGLYPNGSTGEFTRFTADERRRIIEIVVDETRGRVPILAGAAEANVRETLRACEHYHELGVRAVAVVAPFYYRASPANVYAYFKEIGRHTPVDVTLYNIPMLASPIDVATVQRLSEDCEKIVAIKDSSGELAHMMRMIQAVRPNRPEFSFLTGWDPGLMSMLQIGADGGTLATAGIAPEMTRKIYDLTLAGRIEDARNLQYKILKLFDAVIYSADFPAGVRQAVELRGLPMGVGRQPLADEVQTLLATVKIELVRWLADEGLAE